MMPPETPSETAQIAQAINDLDGTVASAAMTRHRHHLFQALILQLRTLLNEADNAEQ